MNDLILSLLAAYATSAILGALAGVAWHFAAKAINQKQGKP